MMTAANGSRLHRTTFVIVTLALVAAACGGDDAADETTTTSTTAVATTTTALPTTTTSTTMAPTTTTTTPGPTTTTLPGLPFESGPQSGDILGVVAVSFDDVLNLRVGPGTDYEVLRRIPAREDRVIANGRAQALPNSIWYEVTFSGVTGWASSTYLAYLGEVNDLTSQIVADIGEIPAATTMQALGQVVADTFEPVERPLRVRMSGEPSVGDLGEVIYDVVGFADDSVRGLRLHVFGQPSEDGSTFSLKSVEAVSLCARGVTDEGVCI
jgi:uncharacterized protein YgiM (DUF1202 family)